MAHWKTRPHTKPNTRGFSLLELSLVIVLIGLLAGIGVGVSATMVDAGRKHATENLIQTLDQTLASYIDRRGTNPPALIRVDSGLLDQEVIDIVGQGNDAYYPAIDGVIELEIPGTDPVRHYRINTIGLYLAQIRDTVEVEAVLSDLDPRFVRVYGIEDDLQPELLTVFDAWGNPIRYVHPTFDGILDRPDGSRRGLGEVGEFIDIFDTGSYGYFSADALPDTSLIVFDSEGARVRRNKITEEDQLEAVAMSSADYPLEADSDGGICKTNRPYFYSAGPDGDPSTIEDNIYSTDPEFISPF